MAVLIHKEIKDEQVIPLARLLGALPYGEFIDKQVDEEIEEEITRPIDGDPKGKTETVKVKKTISKTVREKVVPPSFEQHLKALQQYFQSLTDREVDQWLGRLVLEDPEIKAKQVELEALISSKKG